MKNKTGLIVAILGIMILAATIIYQAQTATSALLMMPVGLGITFIGFLCFLEAI